MGKRNEELSAAGKNFIFRLSKEFYKDSLPDPVPASSKRKPGRTTLTLAHLGKGEQAMSQNNMREDDYRLFSESPFAS